MIQDKIYTLDELYAEILARYGEDVTIRGREWGGGLGADWELWKGDERKATWESRLVLDPPKPGSNEPRGPSEYFNLKFL